MKKHYALILMLSSFIFSYHGIHAQQQAERLSSYTYYEINVGATEAYQPSDSTIYIYSGSRSADTVWYPLQEFDSSYSWQYTTGAGYTPYSRDIQTWSAGNQLLTDTTVHWDTASASYVPYQLLTFFYNSSGQPESYYGRQWNAGTMTWDISFIYLYTYNSSGQLTERIEYGSGTDTLSVFTIAYAGSHYVSDTVADYDNNFIYRYIYNFDTLGRYYASLYQTSYNHAPWKNVSQGRYSFGASGDIAVDTGYGWSAGAWQLTQLNFHSYDSRHHDTATHCYQVDTNFVLYPYLYRTNTFDSYGMQRSILESSWSTTDSAWLASQGYHFYYELYNLPSGIATISNAGDAHIYPIPAASMLSVDIQWTEAQAATMTIYDMSGRSCGSWPVPDAASYHGYMPVSQLPAGVYTMQIRGTKGSINKSFTVMK